MHCLCNNHRQENYLQLSVIIHAFLSENDDVSNVFYTTVNVYKAIL